MFRFLKRFQKTKIPSEESSLIGRIHSRYCHPNETDLLKLIAQINEDSEISKLHKLRLIGSIHTERQERGAGFHAGSGDGLNVCIGERGLFIYDWDDFENKHNEIPLTSASAEKYLKSFDTEKLRIAILGYTDPDSYARKISQYN